MDINNSKAVSTPLDWVRSYRPHIIATIGYLLLHYGGHLWYVTDLANVYLAEKWKLYYFFVEYSRWIADAMIAYWFYALMRCALPGFSKLLITLAAVSGFLVFWVGPLALALPCLIILRRKYAAIALGINLFLAYAMLVYYSIVAHFGYGGKMLHIYTEIAEIYLYADVVLSLAAVWLAGSLKVKTNDNAEGENV